jgi:hypothetical protein
LAVISWQKLKTGQHYSGKDKIKVDVRFIILILLSTKYVKSGAETEERWMISYN